MPPLNLRRVERASARAAGALGRKVPDELVGLADRYAEARDSSRRRVDYWTEVVNAKRAAETLLARAVELERQARVAQEAAVEALRYTGAAAPSWVEVGELVGMSGQGAHKRYRHLEGPEAQRTIDDELEALS